MKDQKENRSVLMSS